MYTLNTLYLFYSNFEIFLRIDPTLCASALAKANELALQNDQSCTINVSSWSILDSRILWEFKHNAADLDAVQQGENLYCGWGEGCMAKTIAQHMEIGKFLHLTSILYLISQTFQIFIELYL